jgi:hypothetical protein
MKAVIYVGAIVLYFAAIFYLLSSALGFSLGVRTGGNMFVEAGPGFERTTNLVLLGLLLCGGLYGFWRINRRSV